jgi:Recombination endonuclease VII
MKAKPWSKTVKKCECPKAYALGLCRSCYLRAHYAKHRETYLKYYTDNKQRLTSRRRERRAEALKVHRKYMKLPEPTRPAPALCESCQRPPIKAGRVVAMCLDHDHSTGAFRGWLCPRCNGAIGWLGDSVDSLRQALAYLERAQ